MSNSVQYRLLLSFLPIMVIVCTWYQVFRKGIGGQRRCCSSLACYQESCQFWGQNLYLAVCICSGITQQVWQFGCSAVPGVLCARLQTAATALTFSGQHWPVNLSVLCFQVSPTCSGFALSPSLTKATHFNCNIPYLLYSQKL